MASSEIKCEIFAIKMSAVKGNQFNQPNCKWCPNFRKYFNSWMPKCSTALENFKSGTKLVNQHGDRYGSKVSENLIRLAVRAP